MRDLLRRGIEPLPQICKRMEVLKPDEGLLVIAPFLPSPLVEKFRSEGFVSRIERGQGTDWVVYFWCEA